MITRRNWLLRCSIIINIVVLVYICSQLVYRDNSLQLPSAAYLQLQNGAGSGQGLLVDQMGRKQLSLDSPPTNNVVHSSSSSSSINNNNNLISANGIGASNDAQPVSPPFLSLPSSWATLNLNHDIIYSIDCWRTRGREC